MVVLVYILHPREGLLLHNVTHYPFLILGEPYTPQAAVSHNRLSLTTSTVILGACDYDFTKFNLTPSVYLVCDIPDNHLKSFY